MSVSLRHHQDEAELAAILRAIEAEPGRGVWTIAGELGLSRGRVQSGIALLRRAGAVITDGQFGAPRPAGAEVQRPQPASGGELELAQIRCREADLLAELEQLRAAKARILGERGEGRERRVGAPRAEARAELPAGEPARVDPAPHEAPSGETSRRSRGRRHGPGAIWRPEELWGADDALAAPFLDLMTRGFRSSARQPAGSALKRARHYPREYVELALRNALAAERNAPERVRGGPACLVWYALHAWNDGLDPELEDGLETEPDLATLYQEWRAKLEAPPATPAPATATAQEGIARTEAFLAQEREHRRRVAEERAALGRTAASAAAAPPPPTVGDLVGQVLAGRSP
ncbi:MAG: hypothetical protein M9894_16305 [Planctomycetes bacterium]|nr:hypothetical protein [Planctomycetota bacterium]